MLETVVAKLVFSAAVFAEEVHSCARTFESLLQTDEVVEHRH
jgi:hypothetical protein